MSSVSIRGLDDVLNMLEKLEKTSANKSVDEIKKFTFDAKRKVSERITDGSNGSLKSRTGELRRSIRTQNTGKHLSSMKASIYTVSKYAKIHEEGGTIKAKRAFKKLSGGPFLAIPSNENKTPSGVTRETPREVFNSGGYTVPINGRKAKHAMFKNGKPMFWLVKEVKIPARLKMRETIEDEVPTLLSRLSDLLDDAAR
jgi:phage gpG-like protein